MSCYCNSHKTFEHCCQPIISGILKAETAEQLMRSRYSAYVIADIKYLMKSHHSSTRPNKEKKNILKWTKSVRWLGLEILSKNAGTVNDKDGYVEFKALFEENGMINCIHENSYFVKENDVWYYQSGIHK